MIGAALARLDLALEKNPLDASALRKRARIMLQMDNPWELAHAARMLVHFTDQQSRVLLDHCLIRLLNAAAPARNISIGGGANYHHAGWHNFDSASGPLNPWPLAFTPQTTFPVPDKWARLVYSSHCLEHLDDATVSRVLSEARRMLRPDGALVLKLPDFEQVLDRWRAGDEAYFDQWGMADVIPTWKNMGMEATIDAKAAMIFCGWWNDAYGDEFGRRRPEAERAYHGPAVIENLRERMENELARWENRPYGLSKAFVGRVNSQQVGAHFNHRNAWCRTELRERVLKEAGFAVLSQDAAAIIKRYADIPGILDQRPISMYALAA